MRLELNQGGNIFVEGVGILAEMDGVSEVRVISIEVGGRSYMITGVEHHDRDNPFQVRVIPSVFLWITGDVEVREGGEAVVRDGVLVYG